MPLGRARNTCGRGGTSETVAAQITLAGGQSTEPSSPGNGMWEPPWYGTVCPVVWEDGEGNLTSYPISSVFASNQTTWLCSI